MIFQKVNLKNIIKYCKYCKKTLRRINNSKLNSCKKYQMKKRLSKMQNKILINLMNKLIIKQGF